MSTDLPAKPKWFTIRNAAEYLQIGEPTIYRWMRDGKITFRKIGDSTRFLQEDLDAVVVVHPSGKHSKSDLRCSSCGSTDLIEGKCQSTGLLYFVPEKSKFWTLKTSNVPMKSKMCENCGFINLKGDTEHLSKLLTDQKEGEEK
jgi:excisionase family DNA binding protein